jgi:2,5-diamino-6-(ribosylamino)-4(3H)-pyrimidinone 5'-phosphate reductase
MLHVFRKSEFVKDVIVFIAENTPEKYQEYLEERQYDGIVAGENRIDLRKTLEILAENYGAKTVLIDAGTTLNSILLADSLVDEVSLLISPTLVGNESLKVFEKLIPIGEGIKLKLIENVTFENNHVLLKYIVLK